MRSDALGFAADRWGAAIVAMFLLCVYFLFGSGGFATRDAQVSLAVTHRLMDGQAPNLTTAYLTTPGVAGLRFSHFGLLLSLWYMPFFGLGALLSWLTSSSLWLGTPEGPLPFASLFFCTQSNAFAGALLHFYFYRICRRFLDVRASIVLTLISGLSTICCVYSKNCSVDLLLGFLMMGALYHLTQVSYSNSVALHAALAGAYLGACFNGRPNYLLVFVGGALWAAWRCRRALPALVVAYIPWGLLAAGYNLYRFGSPFDFGYLSEALSLNPLPGLYNILLNPNYAVVVFSPPTALAAYGLWRARRDPLVGAIISLTLPAFLFHVFHHGFDGRLGWGPRYAVPLVPLWNLGLIFVWRQNGGIRFWLWTCVLISFLLQAWAVLLPTDSYWDENTVNGANGELFESVYAILLQGKWPPWNLWFLRPVPPGFKHIVLALNGCALATSSAALARLWCWARSPKEEA